MRMGRGRVRQVRGWGGQVGLAGRAGCARDVGRSRLEWPSDRLCRMPPPYLTRLDARTNRSVTNPCRATILHGFLTHHSHEVVE